MEKVFFDIVQQALALHKDCKFDDAERLYQRVLNVLPNEPLLLFLLGDLYLRKGYNGLAINVLERLVHHDPLHSMGWCNLGAAYRNENHNKDALRAWKKSIATGGETPEVCNNMASLYADSGEPNVALLWCNKALKLKPNEPSILWQKSLAVLSLGQYAEGFSLYENRKCLEDWDNRSSILAPEWKGQPVEHVYLHGEQGVGDEVMFLALMRKVAERCSKITLELNPKVANLVPYLDKEVAYVTNIVTKETQGDYCAKLPIGSLFHLFGMPTGEAYIHPYLPRVRYYKSELAKLGKGPYVAVCWFGGTKKTKVAERSINLSELSEVLSNYTCVSGQYNLGNPCIEEDRIRHGLPKINAASCGDDLAEQAALFAAVDAVVTVQQTAVHVAGAVGANTFILVSNKPDWRHGLLSDKLVWYNSAKLYRQKNNWADTIKRLVADLPKKDV